MSTVVAPRLRGPLGARALRFGRSLVVGSIGTTLDFAALSFSLRVVGLTPSWARVVGLLVGGVVLFYGSRSFAFRVQSESALGQARRFVIAEVLGFPLNIVAFKALLWLWPHAAPELLSLVANFALFVTYYYPVRSLVVFKARPALVVSAAPAPTSPSAPPSTLQTTS